MIFPQYGLKGECFHPHPTNSQIGACLLTAMMSVDIFPRFEHQIVSFDEWKNNSPSTLLESACWAFLKNLPKFCHVRMGILYLRPEVVIPMGASDALLQKYIQMRHVINLSEFNELKRNTDAEDDMFLGIFFNHEASKPQTRLSKMRLEDLKITADVLNTLIRSHPDLEELNFNATDTHGSVLDTIGEHAKRLKKLNFQNFQTVYGDEMQRLFRPDDPRSSAVSPQRQVLIDCPGLVSFGVKRKVTPTSGAMFTT